MTTKLGPKEKEFVKERSRNEILKFACAASATLALFGALLAMSEAKYYDYFAIGLIATFTFAYLLFKERDSFRKQRETMRWMLAKLDAGVQAVSPVLAVILMVAITCVVAMVVFILVSDLGK